MVCLLEDSGKFDRYICDSKCKKHCDSYNINQNKHFAMMLGRHISGQIDHIIKGVENESCQSRK
jgi:hypothetical protein